MSKIISEILEWCQNDMNYLQELIDELQDIVNSREEKEYIYNKLEKLNKEDLLKLLMAYSDYIMNFYEEHDCSSFPVCIYEFYDNEHQEKE